MRNVLLWSSRVMVRRPVIHLVIVVTLALGIGAASAVFSLVHGILFAPLPFPDSERLVRVYDVTPQGDSFSTAPPTLRDIETLDAFDAVGALSEVTDGLILSGQGAPVRVDAAAMSPSLLRLLTTTAIGRTFAAEAGAPGTPVREVVLSHGIWTARFGGRQDVLGEVVRLNDAPFTVVGVLRPGAGFPDTADVWVPLASIPASAALPDRDDRWLSVIGRIRAGGSEDEARDQLDALARRLEREYPQAHAGWRLDLMPLQASLVSPPQRIALWTLAAAVSCLLLLACANVAGLLLIEAIRRDGEFRLRAVLGASAPRLAGQLLAESALLTSAGAILGVGLAHWLVDLVRTHAVTIMPAVARVSVDGPVLATSLLITVVSCLAIGAAPGVRAAMVDLTPGLGGAGQAVRHNRAGARRALVVLEVGLAMVLLAGAALMATSFARLATADSGLVVDGVTAVPLDLSGARSAEVGEQLLQAIESRLLESPVVDAVGATTTYPWRQFGFRNPVTPLEQAATAPPSGLLPAQWRSVTPGFFRAAGVPLLRGDGFADDIRPDGPGVVIVNRTMAERLWPGTDPTGRQILWGGTTGTPRTVVGVVEDIRDVQLDAPSEPMLFVPHAQASVPTLTLLIRSRASTDAIAPVVRDAWRELAPHLPEPEVTALAESRSAVGTRPRLVAGALTAMAGTGVVLAAGGIYALLAFSVALRRRELAVRMAMGSTPQAVTRLVVTDGLRLALTGIVVGLCSALLLGDTLRSAFPEVPVHDPRILAAVAALLFTSALAASYLPARTAARIDPAQVLRTD